MILLETILLETMILLNKQKMNLNLNEKKNFTFIKQKKVYLTISHPLYAKINRRHF